MTNNNPWIESGECKMSYYAEMPNGQVVPCTWLQYEQLMIFGWVHRILTAEQAVLHKIGAKK